MSPSILDYFDLQICMAALPKTREKAALERGWWVFEREAAR
jgi:hypothetical protein